MPTPSRVFSYRSERTTVRQLYATSPGFKDFKDAVARKIEASPTTFIGATDIADFFPRIYQHRLVNALQAATDSAEHAKIRALERMLFRFSENTSYGIPIGPPASRVLAEAVLIDVDSALLSHGIDFMRFVDDYVIFGERAQDTEFGIRVLGETLFSNHGLTLQTAKTRVTLQ